MNSLFTKTFLKSLIPLVIGTTSHLIKTILILNSETISPREDEQALQQFYFTASAITNNGILQPYSCYFSFLLTMLFLEIIIQAALLAKKSLRISTDLPSLKSDTTSPMSKKIVLYIIRLVLLYSLCYFLYLVLFAVISVSCNSYIQQRSPLQLQAPLQESQTRNLEDTYPIIFQPYNESENIKNYAKTGPKQNYSIAPIQQIRASLNMSTSAVVFSNDSTIAFIAACIPSESLSEALYSLQILNIANLASPSLVGSLQFSDTYRGCYQSYLSLLLSTDEKTVFMNLGNALQIIDVSNLTSPANITTSPSYTSKDSSDGLLLLDFLPGHRGLLALGLGSGYDLRLEFINITDFLHPSLILPMVLPPNIDLPSVYVYEESMYISLADNYSSLAFWQIYDISDLTNITIRETMVLPTPISRSGILSIAFSPNYQVAYYALLPLDSPGFELIITDISNKAAPKIMGSVNATIGLSDDDINGIVLSPDNSHIFIVGRYYSLETFDVSDPKAPILLLQTNILDLVSIFISPNGQVALACTSTHGANSLDQIYIVQVYTHIEATQVIDMQDNILGKITTNNTGYFEKIFLSPDGNTLYTPLNGPDKNITLVIDISNPTSPVQRPALHLEGDPNEFLLSFDGQTLFIIASPCTLQVYDLSATTYLSSFPLGLGEICSLILSSDGKTLFMLGGQYQGHCTNFAILNVTNLAQPSVLTNITNTGEHLKVLILSKDGKTAFLAGNNGAFFIYDVSSPASPVPLPPFRGPWKDLTTLVTSPNGQTVFITSGDGPSLLVVDISTPDTPIFLTSIKNIYSRDITLSFDSQILFILTSSAIVALNVSIPASPSELGQFPFEDIGGLAISPDSSTLFINTHSEVTMVNLKPEYLLYLDTNTFPLGETVSINLYVLQRNSNRTYDVVISPYQFTDVSLSTVQYGSTVYTAFGPPIINDIGIPNWASFDQSSGIFTFSPNSEYTVGTYYINSKISKQVNTSAFTGIANINTTAESQDLVITLITLGYLNNQLFLTSSFDPSQPMLLSSQYSSNETEKQIRSVLADYYIEMSTQVLISPSLGLVLTNSPSNQMISITSPSPNPVSLNITLNPVNGVETRFVDKDYILTPTFTPDQSTIHFIGSLLDINTVLSQLIVFMNGLESCDGSIIISDGLNQPITRLVSGISSYFLNSSQPNVNISYLLDQVNQRPLKTGEQFVIPFDPSTFTVTNGEDLTLNLKMQDNKTEVPYWLMLRGFDLTGTPPDQLTGREIKVKIVASNGYQEYEVPFTLNIGISFTYALQLLIKYGGGFITLLGLIFLAHRVYNIVCKRRYRYPKNFIVRLGEEINFKTLYPIAFISKELTESRLITNYIDKKIAKGIKKASKSKIALFFTDPSTLQLDESKLVNVIEETVFIILADQKMKSKLKLYNALLNSRKELIDQLIISEFTIRLLNIDKEKPTKAAFAKIKKHIFKLVNFVECSEYGICKFSIQRQLLQKVLAAYNIKLPSVPVNKEIITLNQPDFDSDLVASPRNSDSRKSIHIEGSEHNTMHQNSLEKPLIPFDVDNTTIHSKTNINVNLLISAIEAYAFRHHNLNAEAPTIHVFAKRRLANISPPKWLKKFMKWDLQSIGYSEKSQNLGYGIRYTIENGILNFFGTVDYDMKDEVLVVQITNMRGRILRELWLKGIEGQPKDALGEVKDLPSC